jgi:hypothetical protein
MSLPGRLGRIAWLLLLAGPAHSSPLEFLPAGDPLEAELRVLDLYEPPAAGGRVTLRHLHTRPVQRYELMGAGALPAVTGPRAIALARIERALQRDATAAFADPAAPRSTPRLLERTAEDQRLEISTAAEARFDATGGDGGRDDTWADGSGLHVRGALVTDRWLLYSHAVIGQLERARRIGDPLIADTDVALHTEDTYVAYTGASERWALQFGRSPRHWGPGEESSLLLSRAAPAFTALAARFRFEPLRADGVILSGTLSTADQRQLAAHRLEWQPHASLRLGVSEAAVYRASGWQPLYVAGVLPYTLVQRLQTEESPDTLGDIRNNVLVGLDGSWRVADGTRLYAEWLVDDLHAKSAEVPNKWGVQLGLDGAGEALGWRVTWNAEYTRLSRWVYTSFFGREAATQGRPIGFPTGPDARRFRTRVAVDPGVAWQFAVTAAVTDRGENALDEPFVPGAPPPPPGSFEGVVERTRDVELSARWWPASGADVAAAFGWSRVDDAAHVTGASSDRWRVSLAARLAR